MCGGTQNLSHASSRESFSEHHHGRGRTIRAVGCLVVAAFKTLIALAIYNLDGNTNFCWSKDRQKLEELLISSC